MSKELYEKIIMDMGKTEKLMPSMQFAIDDENLIFRLEREGNDYIDKDGRTLLMYAVIYERFCVAEYLVQNGADVNARDKRGFSPLHFAAKTGNVDVLTLLLNAGAEVGAQNILGNIPMMECNYATDIHVFQLFLEHGSNPQQKNNYGVSTVDIFRASPAIYDILLRHSKENG